MGLSQMTCTELTEQEDYLSISYMRQVMWDLSGVWKSQHILA